MSRIGELRGLKRPLALTPRRAAKFFKQFQMQQPWCLHLQPRRPPAQPWLHPPARRLALGARVRHEPVDQEGRACAGAGRRHYRTPPRHRDVHRRVLPRQRAGGASRPGSAARGAGKLGPKSQAAGLICRKTGWSSGTASKPMAPPAAFRSSTTAPQLSAPATRGRRDPRRATCRGRAGARPKQQLRRRSLA